MITVNKTVIKQSGEVWDAIHLGIVQIASRKILSQLNISIVFRVEGREHDLVRIIGSQVENEIRSRYL